MNNTEKDPIYYLEKAPVPKAILHMALPMIMGMVLDLVYNIVDAFFIGQLGNTAMLAAITLAFPFFVLIMGIGQIFAIGGGTLIPRLLGEKNLEGVKRASSVNFYVALASGLVLMLIVLPFLSPILSFLGASGEALYYTRDFVTVLLIGSPIIILAGTLMATIRGEGASTVAMSGMIGSVIINMILDPLFIFVLKMNVVGAALGTVVGGAAAVAYFVWYLKTRSKVQSVSLKDFRPNREILGSIFKIGMSAFIFSALAIVSVSMFNAYATGYGDNVIAAFGVANRVVQIVEFLGTGLFEGVIPLLAFAYAAGNQKRLNAVLKTTTLAFIGITAIVGLPMYLFREQIFGLFSPDPQVLEAGYRILQAMLVSVFFTGFTGIITGMFQAFGAGIQSNVMAIVRGVALVPIIYLGHLLFGLSGVIWSLPAAEIGACLVGLALWLTSRKKIASVTLEKRQELVPAME